MNSKMTTSLQLSTTEPKQQKQELGRRLEQEQNQRNGDHVEDCQWGGERGEWQETVQGLRRNNT